MKLSKVFMVGLVVLFTCMAQAKEINFGIISTDSASVQRDRWEPFFRDMEKQTGLTVKSFYAPDYAGVIEAMRFNTAISAMMILATEMEKSDYIDEDGFKKFLKILAPFAPHVTESIWESLGGKKSINISEWPEYDESLIKDDEVKIVVQVNGKVRAEMMIEVDADDEKVKNLAKTDVNVLKFVGGKEIKKIIYVKNRLVNVVV